MRCARTFGKLCFFLFFLVHTMIYTMYIYTHQQQHWSGTSRMINSTELKRKKMTDWVFNNNVIQHSLDGPFRLPLWTTADKLTANYYVIKARRGGGGFVESSVHDFVLHFWFYGAQHDKEMESKIHWWGEVFLKGLFFKLFTELSNTESQLHRF